MKRLTSLPKLDSERPIVNEIKLAEPRSTREIILTILAILATIAFIAWLWSQPRPAVGQTSYTYPLPAILVPPPQTPVPPILSVTSAVATRDSVGGAE